MSSIIKLFVVLALFAAEISCEELFCARDRKLLLGGVFNYDKVLFAYSWKEVNSVQLWLVWRFEIKSKRLVAIGKDTTVDQVFPGIPLFRAGFGLTMKCDKTDVKCNSYRQLVFVFFQTSYKVFRFANDVFSAEMDKSQIPWQLNPRGEVSDWFFDRTSMDNINAIVFVGGYQSQLFIVTKNSLMMSAVDINAEKPKWSAVAKGNELGSVLGGFVFGNQLYFNKNEGPDNVFLKYDQNGKELDKISVWKFFNCDNSQGFDSDLDGRVAGAEEGSDTKQDNGSSLATNLLIGIGVAVVITNLVAAVFWVSVYRKNSGQNETEPQ